MTKLELLNKAEDLHYDLMTLENESPPDEVTDEQFDMMLELSNLMREFIHEKHHKSYFEVPGVKDFYSDRVGEVEIDPDIAEAVKIFNEKGYRTIASCSGHAETKDWYGYVLMQNYPIENVPYPLYKDDKGVIRWKLRSARGLKKCQALLLKYAKSIKSIHNLANPGS